MRVTVKFVGPITHAMGERQHVVNLRKGTVKELLDQIYRFRPKAKENLKLAGVFIEGRLVKSSELQEPILKDGQEVSLILPVAGG